MFKEQVQELQTKINKLNSLKTTTDNVFYYEEVCCGQGVDFDGKKLLDLVNKYKEHLKEADLLSIGEIDDFEVEIQDELEHFVELEEKRNNIKNKKLEERDKEIETLSNKLIQLFKDNGYQEVVISVKDFNLYDCQDIHSILNLVHSNYNHTVNSKTIRFLSNDENIREKIVNEWKKMSKHQDLKSKFNFLQPSINLCLDFKF